MSHMLADGCLQGGCSSCTCGHRHCCYSERGLLKGNEAWRDCPLPGFHLTLRVRGALYVRNKLPGLWCLDGHMLPAGGAHLATLFCCHGALARASAHARELPSTWALLCAAGQSAALPACCTLKDASRFLRLLVLCWSGGRSTGGRPERGGKSSSSRRAGLQQGCAVLRPIQPAGFRNMSKIDEHAACGPWIAVSAQLSGQITVDVVHSQRLTSAAVR